MATTGKFLNLGMAAAVCLGLGLGISPQRALADDIDPLHGFCVAPDTCSDNGTVTPILDRTPNFGFTKSPDSGSGQFYIDVLIPNNVSGAGTESFSISGVGTGNGSASSVGMGNWNTGDLTDFLGRSTAPPNPLTAWLPTTNAFQPSATGYQVYDFSFGTVNFSKKDPTFSSSFSYPAGTIITAFFCDSFGQSGACTDWVSTAQSAALAIEKRGIIPAPEPMTLSLFGIGLLGMGAFSRRRKAKKA